MNIALFASGSSGNCALVSDGETHILIDAGISARRIRAGLTAQDVSMADLAGVLVTHEHSDHVKGLTVLLRRDPVAVYALPAVCGRVCPQERQCESRCVRGIKGEPVGIGRLERFVADWAMENDVSNLDIQPKNGHKVAVVGSGPAGLTCAGELARMGFEVTVFEAFHTAGGVLSYGIPEFRLPKRIVRHEVDNLRKMGVEIKLNMVIGKILSIDELFEDGYEAVFVGTGAGLPMWVIIRPMNI